MPTEARLKRRTTCKATVCGVSRAAAATLLQEEPRPHDFLLRFSD